MFLINWLSGSGHRLSTGEPNSSGTLRVLSPGTQTLVNIFDANGGTITQPVELDAAGKATVYVQGPVDLAFEDADGAAVQTIPYGDVHGADGVLVESAAFTGTLPSGSQGAGGRTYLDVALLRSSASFGSTDWNVQESASGVPRGLADTLFGIQLPVKGFGAKGDGLADDTAAVQLAINRCAARGGGIVYFDPGTYRISSPLTHTGSVSLLGAGASVVTLKNLSSSGNLITSTSPADCYIARMTLTALTTSTGTAIAVQDPSNVDLDQLVIANHRVGIDVTYVLNPAIPTVRTTRSRITTDGAAASRCWRLTAGPASGNLSAVNHCSLDPTLGKALEVSTVTGAQLVFIGNVGVGGILFTNVVGGPITLAGNSLLVSITGTTPQLLDMDSMWGASTSSGAASVTPDWTVRRVYKGRVSTGAAGTLNAPTPTPTAAQGVTLTLILHNNSGLAVTWTVDPVYHTTGAISNTDGNITTLLVVWDPQSSVWREVCRAVTT